jgi:hypothetical protein
LPLRTRRHATRFAVSPDPRRFPEPALAAVRRHAVALDASAADDGRLVALLADARFALIGEASHGSDDFYRERAALARRLIAERRRRAHRLRALPDPDVAPHRRRRVRRVAARPQRRRCRRRRVSASTASTCTACSRRSRPCSPSSTASIHGRWGRRARDGSDRRLTFVVARSTLHASRADAKSVAARPQRRGRPASRPGRRL